MTAMGIPVRSRDHIHHVAEFVKKGSSIDSLNARSMKSLSGNGMHCAVIGCLVMCLMQSIEPVQDRNEGA